MQDKALSPTSSDKKSSYNSINSSASSSTTKEANYIDSLPLRIKAPPSDKQVVSTSEDDKCNQSTSLENSSTAEYPSSRPLKSYLSPRTNCYPGGIAHIDYSDSNDDNNDEKNDNSNDDSNNDTIDNKKNYNSKNINNNTIDTTNNNTINNTSNNTSNNTNDTNNNTNNFINNRNNEEYENENQNQLRRRAIEVQFEIVKKERNIDLLKNHIQLINYNLTELKEKLTDTSTLLNQWRTGKIEVDICITDPADRFSRTATIHTDLENQVLDLLKKKYRFESDIFDAKNIIKSLRTTIEAFEEELKETVKDL